MAPSSLVAADRQQVGTAAHSYNCGISKKSFFGRPTIGLLLTAQPPIGLRRPSLRIGNERHRHPRQ